MIVIYSLIAVLATASFAKMLHFAIQDGQILGGWQKVLMKMDMKGSKWVKPLGLCEMCFAHLLAQISFWVYVIVLHFIHPIGWWNALLYVCYVPVCSMANLYFIVKLFGDGNRVHREN